jgi:hypothetical protein
MTKERITSSDGSPEPGSMEQILGHPRLQRHIRSMYRIGTVKKHESAFAVYQQGNDVNVSKLRQPKPESFLNAFSEQDAFHRYVSLDGRVVMPLVSYSDNAITEFDDDLYIPSEHAQRTISGILESTDIDDDEEKRYYIDEVKMHDHRKQITGSGSEFRRDIAFFAHNHPQDVIGYHRIESLSAPSGADVEFHTTLQSDNPHIVSGIVVSDGTHYGLRLYAAEANRDQEPSAYAEDFNYDRGENHNLRALARAGFVHILLKLDNHGQLLPPEHTSLADFVRQVK